MAALNGSGHSAEMSTGETSQFDVLVDDELAFSKRRDGRFPDPAEVLAALQPTGA